MDFFPISKKRRGKLTNQADRLLKNREMEEAKRVITIAKPKTGSERPEAQIVVGLGRLERSAGALRSAQGRKIL